MCIANFGQLCSFISIYNFVESYAAALMDHHCGT